MNPKVSDQKSAWLPFIRRQLRCETQEQCERIQKGSIYLKRLGKWSILFSVGVTFFISDIVALVLDSAQGVERVTSSFLYRWTAGWLFDIPSTDISVIAIWKIVDLIQFVFFLGLVAWCVRWVYADSCVNQDSRIGFKAIMTFAAISNVIVYFGLRLLLLSGA